MTHLVALDQGTTSSRAIVYDDALRRVGMAQRRHRQHFPRPGWVEHDPVELWDTQRDVLGEAIRSSGVPETSVAGIGITNQRETVVVWDRASGEPIHRAIVWQDRRTGGMCDALRESGHEGMVRARTGLVLDPYFSATKVRWVLDHTDGARMRAERGELAFGTIDSWLAWNLTGGRVHATDVSNASRTLLWNLREERWDEELLALFDVPRSMLPEVVSSSGEVGRVAKGLPCEGVPIAGIAGDQQAALAGQGCVASGTSKCTFGTGCFLLMQTGEGVRASSQGMLSTAAWRCDGARTRYALEGSVFCAGAAIDWLCGGLGIVEDGKACDALASTVRDAAGLVFVPAFTGLGAPHWDATARGAIVGLTRGTTTAHLCRATLRSIACSVSELAGAMMADAGTRIEAMRVDGGVAMSDVLLQMQADLLRIPVVRPRDLETTARGAAMLAGVGVGVRDSLETFAHDEEGTRVFEPRMGEDEACAVMARWSRAVERAKGWAVDA